ncbi:MAG: hypothetical protein KDD58_10285, partial [Bdellovibrionales bacterium]|nr:hypothetical protein [Bdellovibrionales bacterium]
MDKYIRWPQMAAVLTILIQTFEHNKYADKALESEFKKNRNWGAKDRKIIAETTYDMLRWWRTLHAFLKWDWQKQKTEIDYWTLALLWMKWRNYQWPNWEVSEKIKPILSDINFASYPLAASEEHSITDELYEIGYSELGSKWHEYLKILNEQAPVFLRINSLKTNQEKL